MASTREGEGTRVRKLGKETRQQKKKGKDNISDAGGGKGGRTIRKNALRSTGTEGRSLKEKTGNWYSA